MGDNWEYTQILTQIARYQHELVLHIVDYFCDSIYWINTPKSRQEKSYGNQLCSEVKGGLCSSRKCQQTH